MFPRGEFDSRGRGILTYTGFFGGNDFIAIQHTPGSWEDRWGIDSEGNFIHGDNEEAMGFNMGNDGYYTITLNTQTNELSVMPYMGEIPGPFNAAAMTGSHNSWDISNNDYDMTRLNPYKENHNWIFRNFVVTGNDTELKFTADDDWQNNWGENAFPWGQGLVNGANIPVKAGTYDVYLNDITGDYNFIKK